MDEPRFGTNVELCCTLKITADELSIGRLRPEGKGAKNYLPGQPRIDLQDSRIGSYLEQNFLTRDLDKSAPHLWLVAKQDSSHISSLTQQIFRGREIILTEDPGLHLLWIYDRVYIKPIPRYLLSHAFWKFYLLGSHSPIPESLKNSIAKAALGFLRSYFYLIQHKSDFSLARNDKHRLLPKDISYTNFVRFITAFEGVPDKDVSPRYRFGELRLGRLNMWSPMFLQRFDYRKVHQQYGAYFARFYGPLLFIFATFSLSLSAMQLELAVGRSNITGQSSKALAQVSRGFATFTLACVALIVFVLWSLFVSLAYRETNFAVKTLYHRRNPKTQRDVEKTDFIR